MSFNLLDTVKGFFGNEMIGKAAFYLGESDNTIQKALNAIIPVSLGGIVKKAETNPESLMTLAHEAYNSGILNNLAGTFSSAGGGIPTGGPGLITSLFGDRFGSIANTISSFTSLKGSSVASLFGSIIPLALGLLGKHARDTNAAPGAIASLLGSQKNSILSAMPGGLNIPGLAEKASTLTTSSHMAVEEEKKKSSLLMPILVLGGLALIALILSRTCSPDHKNEVPLAVHDTVVTTKTDTVVMHKEPLKLRLPNGVEIDAYKGGIEDMLIAFLNDPNSKAGKDNWFDFNDLNFKFGTAEIIPESESEVNNIVQILKAYPNAKIKIGGYTDKVGDEGANKKLSRQRADAVTTVLKTAGVGSQLEGAEGYGSEFAKYPASAPEQDRIKDRRVSVSVRAK